MADGCVTKPNKSWVLSVRLAEKDVAHLEKLKEFLGSDHKILRLERREAPWGGASFHFAVTSNQISEDLARYGVVPRKTGKEKAIGLEENRDFWRGVIDGDGCLGIYKLPLVKLCGSKDLVQQFVDFSRSSVGSRNSVRSNKMIFDTTVNGSRAVAMAKLLYGGATVSLDRKKLIADAIVTL